jgi:ornithine carbamoyltransferase
MESTLDPKHVEGMIVLSTWRGRSLLKEQDITSDEFVALVAYAAALKADRLAGREEQRLVGRCIALIFEKTSTRTRAAFEVAAAHQGASVTYLSPDGSQIGHKESIADTARVLGRMYDGIEFRGHSQEAVEELAEHAGVPV